jgi:hypothetical protein
MKTKNVILGILALAFAIGSAFGSKKLTAGNGYLKIKYVDESEIACQHIANCPGGIFACYARINDSNY